MPRIARAVGPGAPHHVTQRGNNRQDVFFVDDDRRAYLELLKHRSQAYGLDVLGYCLMTNHVHLIVVPNDEEALARAIGRTHYHYTQYINRRHGRSGHLWQNRFHSCPMDEPHLWQAMCYVERNPVRARMVRLPRRYRWSSAAAHCGGDDESGLLDLRWWSEHWRAKQWEAELREPQSDEAVARLRVGLRTGRPLGTDRFISKLESLVGRRLRALPRGRPKKKTPDDPVGRPSKPTRKR